MRNFETQLAGGATGTLTSLTVDVANAQEITVRARVDARDTVSTADHGFYVKSARFEVAGGTLAISGAAITVETDVEDDAGWNCTIDASGNDIRVRGTADGTNATTFKGTLEVWRRR